MSHLDLIRYLDALKEVKRKWQDNRVQHMCISYVGKQHRSLRTIFVPF